MENTFGLSRPGHYNEMVLLMRWLLSEVSLYPTLTEIIDPTALLEYLNVTTQLELTQY